MPLLIGRLALNAIPGITALDATDWHDCWALSRLIPFFVDPLPDRSEYDRPSLADWFNRRDREILLQRFESWLITGADAGLITWAERHRYATRVWQRARADDLLPLNDLFPAAA